MGKPDNPLSAADKGQRPYVRQPVKHDSADKHVSGEARYIDDLTEPSDLLHVYMGVSQHAHAEILNIDLNAVRRFPGVEAVLTTADIPGINDTSPIHNHDDPIFADRLIEFHGQVLFAVAAETRDAARRAARLAKVEVKALPAILTIEEALKQQSFVQDTHVMQRGDAEAALAQASNRLNGELNIGGQDHFYLEGQAALAIPQEDGDMLVHSSTQHPSEVQQLIAQALEKPTNAITVEVRRMGGAFGGKETQAAQWAVIASLVAAKTGRAAKVRLDRDEDMTSTGKRHDFLIRYDVGFDNDGRIQGIDLMLAARCGMSADLSGAICDRAMFHSDNAYYLPSVKITSHRCKTHTVSNTAFRGFGGPQGMMGIERVIDAIAIHLKLDPLTVRQNNFYGQSGRNLTPYYMKVEDFILPQLLDDLLVSSGYTDRRAEIESFNQTSPVIKKGIALTPVKFGISFTTTFLNQAGALLHIYKDGSIHLNHGGTEMGQGLYIKVAQVVAQALQVDLERIKVSSARTDKVPNTSATAASSGADMNGMAALIAANKIKQRLIDFAAEHYDTPADQIAFADNQVQIGQQQISFNELVMQAYLGRVSLSATGYYKTPKIHYDREKAKGRPFLYFGYGAAVSEVAVDTLTGEYQIERVDILHDVGQSLNPAIDLGQIEGGFIQGAGWLTTEELFWDQSGQLRTHAPSTYKIPVCGDVPEAFNVEVWQPGRNREPTIYRSKAVGEPPLMLAISVYSALNHAVSGVSGHTKLPELNAPATPEQVLFAVQKLTTSE